MLRKLPSWCSYRGAETVGASNGNPFVPEVNLQLLKPSVKDGGEMNDGCGAFNGTIQRGRIEKVPSTRVTPAGRPFPGLLAAVSKHQKQKAKRGGEQRRESQGS